MLSNKPSASIERDLQTELPRLYRDARRAAVRALEDYAEEEAARLVAEASRWSLDDVLRDDWYPEPALPGQGATPG